MDKILSKAFKSNDLDIEEMSLEIKEKKIVNPILEEYKKKYKPEELTDDGIPNIETQIKELKILDEEQEKTFLENKEKIYNREMVQRVKCLCLLKMNKSIFINTLDMNNKDRKTLQNLMYEYNDIEHIDIVKEFNEKIGDLIDDNSEIDISNLPIYDFK